jgi:uncharacterized protein (TIGR03435 family)
MTAPFIVNHLWQSSCFALLAALLALMLRGNSPKVRYWVWLSASLKFLLPFVLLASLGSLIPRHAQDPVFTAAPVFTDNLLQIAEPFSPTSYASIPAHDPVHWIPVMVAVVWVIGFLTIILVRCRSWLRVRVALQAGTPIELPIPVCALITPGTEEPGIVGFLRPVLVLPAKLLENLNPPQLSAILTHELCHVRRHDNLFAAVHMIVEAMFWFNPLVWWIGSRMVEERELACDEEVLRMGCEPADYVEGILKVCRFYTESPLPCISGVTGADVKKRLRSILAGNIAQELNGAKKIALATIGLAAFAAPVLIGVLNATAILAQDGTEWQVKAGGKRSFDVASVKPTKIDRLPNFNFGPGDEKTRGGLLSATLDVRGFIEFAYKLARFQTEYAYAHAPEWVRADRYAIDAKAQGDPTKDQTRLMMQSLLADRFKLAVHFENKRLPVLALRQVKPGQLGPKLIPHSLGPPCPEYEMSVFGATPPNPRKDVFPPTCGGAGRRMNGTWFVGGRDVTMATATQTFYSYGSLMSEIDRPVVDQTGLNGTFDFVVEFNGSSIAALHFDAFGHVTDAPPGAAAPSGESGTPLVDALRQQLGLKLVRTEAPVRVLVIDRVERPSAN